VSCFKRALESNEPLVNKWLSAGQPKIVLKVNSLDELDELKRKANELDIINALILDAGRTQVIAGTATCLGLLDHNEKLDLLTKELKLL
jgi:peptidyl-tRNA hydrolase